MLRHLNFVRYEKTTFLEENKTNDIEKNKELKEKLENYEAEIRSIKKHEDQFLKIIEEIFEFKSPNMTIKIGI